MRVRALAIAALLTAVAGCGAARRGAILDAQLDRAAALAAEGCYDCLREALAIHLAAVPPRAGSPQAVRLHTDIFRVSLLAALRAKELGLDATADLERARTHAPRTSAPVVAAEQLALAERLPVNASALPRDVAEAQQGGLNEMAREIERRLGTAAAASDPLDVYLNVSVACTWNAFRGTPALDALAAPAASDTIVQWRVAICGRSHEEALRAFAAAHPRYVEADYWLGRYRLALVGEPSSRREARTRLRAVDAAIPGSPAIAVDLAGVTRVTSPKDALPLYERVTRRVPRHHEAWLGQGICLTYLERPREAVDALSRVVDLKRWYVADALYWRAWNRHTLGDLDAAWVDVEAARKILYNTDVYALAGRIAFERKALDVAQPLLEKARELSAENCGAAWFLGLVHTTQERWVAGAEVFEAAEACYRGEIDRIRQQQAMDARDPEESVRAARQVQSDAAIRTAERQAALSAYNAAFAFVRGERRDRSRPLLARAVQHAEVNDRARELLAFLDR